MLAGALISIFRLRANIPLLDAPGPFFPDYEQQRSGQTGEGQSRESRGVFLSIVSAPLLTWRRSRKAAALPLPMSRQKKLCGD
jgi:hypothetical protein